MNKIVKEKGLLTCHHHMWVDQDKYDQLQAENVLLREYVEWVVKCADTIPLMQHKGYVKNIITNAKCLLEALNSTMEE